MADIKDKMRSLSILYIYVFTMNTTTTTLTQTPAPLEDDGQFQTALKQWTALHDKCTSINSTLTEYRKMKTELNTKICEYWERKQWQTRPIDLKDGQHDNGSLHYATEKQRPTFTQAFLTEKIKLFFENEASLIGETNDPQTRTSALLQFLNDQRDRSVTYKATIKRKYAAQQKDAQ